MKKSKLKTKSVQLRLVQISAVMDAEGFDSVYGLDAEGKVWYRSGVSGTTWKTLGMDVDSGCIEEVCPLN